MGWWYDLSIDWVLKIWLSSICFWIKFGNELYYIFSFCMLTITMSLHKILDSEFWDTFSQQSILLFLARSMVNIEHNLQKLIYLMNMFNWELKN